MPRPARYDADTLLDAALALAVDHTPTGISMAEIARHTGAPSGSVYHRFPSRAMLLGELRLRTITRFQDGFLTCLANDDPRLAAGAAARHVVDWSRAHPEQARLLLYPRRDFAPQEWPAELTSRAATQDRRLRTALRALAGRLNTDLDQVLIAVVDLPHAVVRRHLTTHGTIPANAANQVETCAATLLPPSQGPQWTRV